MQQVVSLTGHAVHVLTVSIGIDLSLSLPWWLFMLAVFCLLMLLLLLSEEISSQHLITQKGPHKQRQHHYEVDFKPPSATKSRSKPP